MSPTMHPGCRRAWNVLLALFLAMLVPFLPPAPAFVHRPALASSTICLNEFLPRPCAAPPDGAGLAAVQTFVELYNYGADPVDLSGWIVKVEAQAYTITAGTSLRSGGYLVVAKGLSFGPTGAVTLLNAASGSVDKKSYNNARCNLSIGRYPNGGANWYDSMAPSPGGPNSLATATTAPAATRTVTRVPTPTSRPEPSATPAVAPSATARATARITPGATRSVSATSKPTPPFETVTSPANTASPIPATGTASTTPSVATATPLAAARLCLSEFLAAPRSVDWDGDGVANYADEWIELYNPGTEEIDLHGWQLDDRAGGGSNRYTFPAGARLSAGDYGLYYQRQTGLALNNNGDDVRLIAPDGREVDRFAYTLAAPDASYARRGGCTGTWAMDQAPSPGQPNPAPPDLYLPLICSG